MFTSFGMIRPHRLINQGYVKVTHDYLDESNPNRVSLRRAWVGKPWSCGIGRIILETPPGNRNLYIEVYETDSALSRPTNEEVEEIEKLNSKK